MPVLCDTDTLTGLPSPPRWKNGCTGRNGAHGKNIVYLLNIIEETNVVEASLGGRIDASEMKVMGEEIAELLAMVETENFYVLLDYSKAKPLDGRALIELAWIKDTLLESGATKIVNIARDDRDIVDGTTDRIQHVLEGREEFLLNPAEARFPQLAVQHVNCVTYQLKAA